MNYLGNLVTIIVKKLLCYSETKKYLLRQIDEALKDSLLHKKIFK